MAGGPKVIVGLGNPGLAYAQTRHNVGFQVVRRLGRRWLFPWREGICNCRVAEGSVKGESARLILPQTFMNTTGQAVACLARRWRLDPTRMLLVCDDVALPLGIIRIRPKGSAGGHQGLTSIFQETGTEAMPRLRVGIGRAGLTGDLVPYVLGRFTSSEQERLGGVLDCAAQACETWVTEGIPSAMNRFNRKVTERE